jgi:hypothetical protein
MMPKYDVDYEMEYLGRLFKYLLERPMDYPIDGHRKYKCFAIPRGLWG